jgi:polyisoprenoid-binding protein YceI
MTRRWILPAALVVLSAAALVGTRDARSAPAESAWKGDTVHSFVMFRIGHNNGISLVFGRFDDFTVSLKAGEGDAGLTSVAFTVKADSVDTGNAKRDQHVKGIDFFNAKQFPEIAFQSTKLKALDKGTTEVTGDLTLHGVTKPVTVKVSKVGAGKGMKGEDLAGYETSFTIKRSDFGMTNMVGPVGDEVTLTVAVEAAKQ